jgi:hypothetical protein
MEENNNNNEAHESTINHQHINTEQQQGLKAWNLLPRLLYQLSDA